MYQILYDNPNETLITRLLKVRNITEDSELFLNPTRANYRGDALLLHDCQKGIDRIIKAIEHNEKTMIFGDYDVDGQCASYIMYTFFHKFCNYKNISVRLPHRVHDGYGIKCKHIEEIKNLDCSLIITVDNGITAIEEAIRAKELGIDLIITDHHQKLEIIPDAFAIINPDISPDYPHRHICGAMVAFKVIMMIAKQLGKSQSEMKKIFEWFLPFVCIATIADCMPLTGENRLVVKKGLELMNGDRKKIAPSLAHMLETLNIEEIDTFHIGFMIAPRLNAAGRLDSAHSGLKYLITEDKNFHQQHFEHLDGLNTSRKKIQDDMIKIAQSQVDHNKYLLYAMSEEFHEGIVGIVSGKLTEKYYKPSLVLGINKKEGIAMGSLRGPDYFNVVEMLKTAEDLLLRYGGHAQAGGITVALEHLDAVLARFHAYCDENMGGKTFEKVDNVDTRLYPHEINYSTLKVLFDLAPFGQANTEPLLLIENFIINTRKTIGKNGGSHLKLIGHVDGFACTVLFRGKAEEYAHLVPGMKCSFYGNIKKDSYSGGFFVDGKNIVNLF